MANFHLDTSAIGNEYQAYADTPATWGMPQDGNGKAGPGHSAAVAIATIDCASASASGAGALSLLGQTISSTLTGSGATLAANIVTAINAYSTAVISTYSALLLPLNKLVFARQHPTTTTLVQIMVRIAGADWNGMVPVSGGTWGTAPTMGAFSGGLDGPFAYMFSASTLFGKTALTYGICSAKSSGVTEPGSADVIHVRTKRGGSNLTHTHSSGASQTLFNVASARNYLFDNGTIWSGDNGSFKLNLTSTGNGASWQILQSAALRLAAREKYGLTVTWTSSVGVATFAPGTANANLYEAVNIEFVAANSTSTLYLLDSNASNGNAHCSDCRYSLKASYPIIYRLNSNTATSHFKFTNCDIEWTGIGANVTGIIALSGSFTNTPNSLIFTNCKLSVDGGSYSVTSPVTGVASLSTNSALTIAFNNCSGMFNASAGFIAQPLPTNTAFLWDDANADRSFRYETPNYQLSWQSGGTYPTYNTMLPSGAYMSQRLTWEKSRLTIGVPITVGRYGAWYKDVAATKTITMEFLVPTAEIPTKAQLVLSIKYTGSDDVTYFISSQESYGLTASGQGSALASGVGIGAWTLNGVTAVSSVKISLTTNMAIKQGSEIAAELIIVGPPGSNRVIYINPDLVIS